MEFPANGLDAVPDFMMTIGYVDVAGKSWQTRARYVAAQRRYEDISVTAAER